MSLDQYIIISVLTLTFLLGLLTSRRAGTVEDYITGSKSFSSPVIIATIFATVIGGGSTYGIIEKVYTFGISFAFSFFGMAFNRILVGMFIAPKIADLPPDIQTIPQIMERFYGRIGRFLTAIFSLATNAAGTGIQCFAMGKILQAYLGIDFMLGAMISAALVVGYSAAGGIRSVVYTDVLQFLIIVVSVPIALTLSLDAAGGFGAVFSHATSSNLLSFKIDSFYIFLSFLLGAADPPFLHRLLIADDIKKVIFSFKVSGWISVGHYLCMGLIGLCAAKIFAGTVHTDPLVDLITGVFPLIFKGLYISAVLAAMMSTADSDLNLVGINVGYDLFTGLSRKKTLLVVRLSTVVIGLISVYVAMSHNDVISIILSTYSFWGPMIMVPLFFALYGRVMSVRRFLFLVGSSYVIQKGWNILRVYTPLDGLVIGICYATTFVYVNTRTQTWSKHTHI